MRGEGVIMGCGAIILNRVVRKDLTGRESFD